MGEPCAEILFSIVVFEAFLISYFSIYYNDGSYPQPIGSDNQTARLSLRLPQQQ